VKRIINLPIYNLRFAFSRKDAIVFVIFIFQKLVLNINKLHIFRTD